MVWVEFVGGAFVEGFAHEAGDVGEAEPGLVFELEGAELAVVADEDMGFEAVGHRLVPLAGVGDGCGDLDACDACNVKAPGKRAGTLVVKRRVAAVRRLTNRLQDPADPKVSDAQPP